MATHNQPYGKYTDKVFLESDSYNIGIVVSEWNAEITQSLLNAALDTLIAKGVKKQQIVIEYVPGSSELTFGANFLTLFSITP